MTTVMISPNDDLTAAIATARGGKLLLTSGIYPIAQPLVLPNNLILECEPNTIIRAVAPMDTMVTMELRDYGIQQLCIRNLTLDGNKKAQTCMSLSKVSMSHFTAIDGLLVKNAIGDGLRLLMCQGAVFQSIKALQNGGVGIQLLGCNAGKFYGVTSIQNGGGGIVIDKYIDGATLYSGGLSVYGIHSESNGGHGVVLGDIPDAGVRIDGGWLEGNGGDALQIGGVGAFVSGVSLAGGNTRILSTARGAVLQDNWVIQGKQIIVEAGAQYVNASPNRNRHTGALIDPVIL